MNMHIIIYIIIEAEVGILCLFIGYRISEYLKAKTQVEIDKKLLIEKRRNAITIELETSKKIEKSITGLRSDLAAYMGEKLSPPGEE